MCAKKLNDQDVMNILIDTALSSGATAADCVLSRSKGVSLTRRLGKDETIERYEDFDTGLRVFVENKIASVSTNENSEAAIREVAKRAVDMAKIAPKDEFSLIATQETLQNFPMDDNISVDSYDEVEPSIDIIRDRATEVEDIALSVKGITNSDGADASWGEGETLLMTSNGFFGSSKNQITVFQLLLLLKKMEKWKETMIILQRFSDKI